MSTTIRLTDTMSVEVVDPDEVWFDGKHVNVRILQYEGKTRVTVMTSENEEIFDVSIPAYVGERMLSS